MTDTDCMRRAIALAKRGCGWVNPNPMVGAVIVKDGRIIGEGYHHAYGQPHAERDALAACKESPRGATLYVTLEPCCHYGKTPPCTDAIMEAGIAKVVVGSDDPNPKVCNSAAILRAAGITVEQGFLKTECDRLNPVFFHYMQTGLPYLVLKYAMTADGKIAAASGASKWITGKTARQHVHTLRHRYSGILVGIETVLQDDTLLTCRLEHRRNPTRIICDSRLRLPPDSQICRTADTVPTIVATLSANAEKASALKAHGVQVWILPEKNGMVDLSALLQRLGNHHLDSVLLEGGGELHFSALQTGMVRELYAYIAPKLLGGRQAKSPVSGLGFPSPADAFPLSAPEITPLGQDILLHYHAERKEPICSPAL